MPAAAPAAAPPPASPAVAFAEAAERALDSGEASAFASDELTRALTAAVRLYAAKIDAGDGFAPVAGGSVTPTDVVVVVSEMLRAVDLNLFDLAMWYRRAR
jgi:hypothetical protein